MKRFMKPDDASLTPEVIGTVYQFFITGSGPELLIAPTKL